MMDANEIRNFLTWRIAIVAKRIQDGEEPSIDMHKAVTRMEEILDGAKRASVEELEELWNL